MNIIIPTTAPPHATMAFQYLGPHRPILFQRSSLSRISVGVHSSEEYIVMLTPLVREWTSAGEIGKNGAEE